MASLAPLSANRVLHRNFVYQGQLIGGVELSLALLVGPSPAHQPKASASARPAAGTPPQAGYRSQGRKPTNYRQSIDCQDVEALVLHRLRVGFLLQMCAGLALQLGVCFPLPSGAELASGTGLGSSAGLPLPIAAGCGYGV